ncbi:MAG: serine/threonine-protein phosphatase [Bacteroidales bacterium]|nr:serine/threonine-protein phosphatase [Bacteroidales bacterium]
MRLKTEILSHKGLRKSNEDNLTDKKLASRTYFLAVADGMGGMAGGDLASKSVLLSITDFLKKEIKKKDIQLTLKELLEKSFLVGQTCIADKIAANPQLKGMGTTLAAVLIKDRKYVWGNLGDSRIYVISDGTMKLITEDHSYIQDYLKNYKNEVSSPIITQYKNIVTKIVDGGLDKPDIFPKSADYETLNRGDMFMLCSDGLIIDKTKDYSGFFEGIIYRNRSMKKTAKELINWALDNGSDDNISVVLGRFGSLKKQKPVEDDTTIRILPKDKSGSDLTINKNDQE